MTDKDYEVDYKKPPKDARFKPGQSGNKRGRPNDSKNMKTIVQEFANEKQTYTEDGVTGMVTTRDLILKLLQREAHMGDLKAVMYLDAVKEKYDAMASANENADFLVVPERATLENSPFPIEDVEDD